jgi:hypothetical protein
MNKNVNNSENKEKIGAGRPFIELDPVLLEDLAGIGCTMIEMASICHCSVDTLERNYADVIEKGRQRIRQSLRRKQLEVAMNGSRKGEYASPTMLIWLGKQMLEQRDKQELVGPGGGPIQHEHIDLTGLSDEDLAVVERIVGTATANAGRDTSGTA